jgi:hypothetical protein
MVGPYQKLIGCSEPNGVTLYYGMLYLRSISHEERWQQPWQKEWWDIWRRHFPGNRWNMISGCIRKHFYCTDEILLMLYWWDNTPTHPRDTNAISDSSNVSQHFNNYRDTGDWSRKKNQEDGNYECLLFCTYFPLCVRCFIVGTGVKSVWSSILELCAPAACGPISPHVETLKELGFHNLISNLKKGPATG